jgi:Ribonucleotide reductase, barrel domain
MQQGGVGHDFSSLRPRGASAKSVGVIASGPVSFMRIWDSMCATIISSSARRGAMLPNPTTGEVLVSKPSDLDKHCCTIDQEAD